MEFTKEQSEAIGYEGPFLAVTAGAGSGKTRVLVERICRLLREKKASLNDILAVTFTEKAAAELKERVAKVVNDDLAVANAYIGTLHSFCARILKERAPQIGIDPDFSVMEQHSSGLLLRRSIKDTLLSLLKERNPEAETLVEELDLKGAISCLNELVQYRWHTEKITSSPPSSTDELAKKDETVRQAAMFCYRESLKSYSVAKSNNLDFSDLEIYAIKLLEEKETAKKVRRRFKYIFVDEYQDINDTQARLIELLYDQKVNSLTVVGDMKQSIYRFRGANVHEFENAIAKAGHVVTLRDNFRSTPSILSFINGLFPDFEPLRTSDDNKQPCVFKMEVMAPEEASADERRETEAKMIAEVTPSLKGVTACLFSSLNSLDIYRNALLEAGVPHAVHGGHGFFELKEIIDVINILKLICDNNNAPALLGAARSSMIGLTDDEIYLMCREKGSKELFQSVYQHQRSAVLRRAMEIAPLLSISELIRSIGGKRENIEKLAHIAASIEDRERITLEAFIDYIDSLRSGKNKISDFPTDIDSNLVLMTIHQAKGLEFDNVILADNIRKDPNNNQRWMFVRGKETGLGFKITPFDNPEAEAVPSPMFQHLKELDEQEEDAERMRLLYVALTRAKEKLIIPLHPGAKNDGTWHRFLKERAMGVERLAAISGTPQFEDAAPSDREHGTPKRSWPRAVRDRGAILTPTKLEDFATCRLKYHMKYVLGVPEGSLRPGGISGLPANVQGDIVHKMIENHSKGIRTEIRDICLEMELDPSSISKDGEKEIERQFGNFLKSEYSRCKNARHETPFFFNIGDDHIEGKIDMLIEKGDSWEIVDFKTGNIGASEDDILKRYDVQIRTYALAVAKNSGIKAGKVTLLLLSNEKPVVVSRTISKNDIDRTEKELDDMMEAMSKLSGDDIMGCGVCNFCRAL